MKAAEFSKRRILDGAAGLSAREQEKIRGDRILFLRRIGEADTWPRVRGANAP
jgi:hypothetical protein